MFGRYFSLELLAGIDPWNEIMLAILAHHVIFSDAD